MFISVEQLNQNMGVHKTIARFFVDRKLPENNSFWKGKLLYIGYGNGYVSIPVFYDILFRIGMTLEILLDEKHIRFMEQLMHFAILREKNEINKEEELNNIRDLLKDRVKDPVFYERLNRYHDQLLLKPLGIFGMDYPSLNRADIFLYILCDLPLTETQWQEAVRYWYALHPSYLIIDDVRDFAKDKEDGEDNIVVDLGGSAEAFEETFTLLQKNGETIREINPLLAQFLMDYEEGLRDIIVNY